MISVDTTELIELQKKLEDLASPSVTDDVFGIALRKGAQIVHGYLQLNTPISDEPSGSIPANKGGDTTYERGGALLKSLRTSRSKFKRPEQLQIIVGYSKRRGKAGWRAHFTEYGAYNVAAQKNMPGQFFMKRAEEFTATQVERVFETTVQAEIDKILE